MLTFPHNKINLGLRILRKRADGYHNIETVFFPIPYKDVLEIIRSRGSEGVEFSSTGIAIPGDPKNNLCIKAYQLLKNDFPEIGGIKMHLHKIIPTGAGLGGGSSDAAFALKMLNDLFNLDLTKTKLLDYALKIGSDCPFFINGHPAYATGRGETLVEINVDLSEYNILLINPGIHINTGWAFSNITPGEVENDLRVIIQQPVHTWKSELRNDFETVCFDKFPGLKKIKDSLYAKGATYASLTGSGSSLYGLFAKNITLELTDINYDSRLINL